MKDAQGYDVPRRSGAYAERRYAGAASFNVFTAFGQDLRVSLTSAACWTAIAFISPCCGRTYTIKLGPRTSLNVCSLCGADGAAGVNWREESVLPDVPEDFRFSEGFGQELERAAALALDPLTALVAVGELEASLASFFRMDLIGGEREQMVFPLDGVRQHV